MKRAVFVLFALLALSCAQAQDSHFGIRADVHFFPDVAPDISAVLPLPGIQLGLPILDNIELRASFLSLIFINFLQVDVLYTENLSDALRGYVGVGGDLGSVAFYAGRLVGLHATAGVEYYLGSGIGLFGEVQPIYVVQAPDFLLGSDPDSGSGFLGKLNVGINFHF